MATTSARSTPTIFSTVPLSAVIGAKKASPTNVPLNTVIPTKEPIITLSPWAKLISSMMP
jgi:hypothetical protein